MPQSKSSSNQGLFPEYKSHATVHAFKIKKVSMDVRRGYILTSDHPRVSPLWISETWVQQHKPETGNYYVIYEDGSTGCLNGPSFERTHTLTRDVEAPVPIKSLEEQIATLEAQVKALIDAHTPADPPGTGA